MNNEDRFVTQPISNNNTNVTNTNNTNNPGVVPNIPKATIVSSSSVNTNVNQVIPTVNTNPVNTVQSVGTPEINNVQSVPETTPQVALENTTPQVTNDTGMVTDENLKRVEINYTPPSKFKIFVLIVFFIGMVAFIIFLPDIVTYVNKMKSGDLNYQEEKITTGKLKCSFESSTTNLDKKYSLNLKFANNKLNKVEFSITTRGDVSLDEEALDKLNNTCVQLKNAAKGLSGVYINCEYTDGELVETQNFDLELVDNEKLGSAFTEAGGNHPEYQYGQDMDGIERNLNASGYTCKREK